MIHIFVLFGLLASLSLFSQEKGNPITIGTNYTPEIDDSTKIH